MPEPIVIPGAIPTDLEPMPIDPDWILEGNPVARGKLVAFTPDRISHVVVWECTPGMFRWHFNMGEEIAYLLDGEVFVTPQDGPERRMTGGDIAVFPSESSAIWRVTKPLRKIAVLQKHMPKPILLAVRAWDRFRGEAVAHA